MAAKTTSLLRQLVALDQTAPVSVKPPVIAGTQRPVKRGGMSPMMMLLLAAVVAAGGYYAYTTFMAPKAAADDDE